MEVHKGSWTAPARFKSGASVSGSPLVEIHPHTGADDQAADTFLTQRVKEWTANHRQRGVAYIYCQLEFDRDAFPRGLPNISATVNGKKFLIQETQALLFRITQPFA